MTVEKPKSASRPEGRRWLQMGIELEGGWDKHYKELAQTVLGAAGKTDGSVKGLAGYMGEITTRPHETLDGLIKDTLALYPQYTNETPGFHIHASFTPMDTSLLTTPEFWAYFKRRWAAWGKANEAKMTKRERQWFWDRLDAKTGSARQYCKSEFKPAEQLEDHQDRYTQLNFVAYSKFKTIECRVLPMWETRDIAVESIRELSDIYDTFLNTYEFPPVRFEKRLKTTDADEVLDTEEMKAPAFEAWEETYASAAPKLLQGDDIAYSIEGAMDLMEAFATKDRVLAP